MRKSVFIGGASRSGTTMLGAMLGSHSTMFATPESQFKFDVAPVFHAHEGSFQDVIRFLEKHPRFEVWQFQPDWSAVQQGSIGEMIHSLAEQYAIKKAKPDFTHWIDHTPTNLRHSQLLDAQYPDCKFIHMVRDGRAVMASHYKMDWGSNDPVFAAIKWIEPLCVGLACESAFPDRTLRVHFEKLVLHPVEECMRICAFLGVDFEPDMIRGQGFDVPAFTKAQHALVGQLPDPGRIEDWKRSLTQEDIRLFESLTFDLLPMMGYEKRFPGFVAKPGEIKQAWILFKGALKYLTLDSLKRKVRLSKTK